MKRSKPKKSSISTKEVLNKAIDALEVEEQRSAKGPKHAAASGELKIIVSALLAALIIGAGGYFGYTLLISKPPAAAPEKAAPAPVKPNAEALQQKNDEVFNELKNNKTTEAEQPAPPVAASENTAQASRQTAADTEKAGSEPGPLKAGGADRIEQTGKTAPDIQAEQEKNIPAKFEAIVSKEAGETPKPDEAAPAPVEKNQPVKTAEAPVTQEQVQSPAPQPAQKDGRFAINAGSFPNKSAAESELAKLQAGGFEAYIEEVALAEKGVWYRVKIGRFASQAQAESAQKELKKKFGIRSFIYSRNK